MRYCGNFHYHPPPLLWRLPQNGRYGTVISRGGAWSLGRTKGPSATRRKRTLAATHLRPFRPLPSVSLPRALIYLLVSPQSYRNPFTMADSDLAPDFAPFFSFVSGLASWKLGIVQLTDLS